jgi:hypothetical protein
MYNLYSITKGQKAIRDLAKAMIDHAGNMPSLPAVFPNRMALEKIAPPTMYRVPDAISWKWAEDTADNLVG